MGIHVDKLDVEMDGDALLVLGDFAADVLAGYKVGANSNLRGESIGVVGGEHGPFRGRQIVVQLLALVMAGVDPVVEGVLVAPC